jgi:hypothetical protein
MDALIESSGPITYCAGYKYQLQNTAKVRTEIRGVIAIIPGFVSLDTDGWLTVYERYAWDGPSHPAIQDAHNMRPSLFHDAGYQLLRETDLNERYKYDFDFLYRVLCIEDGMSAERAEVEYQAVRVFGVHAAAKRAKGLFTAGRLTHERE